jgi:ATP-binding cassette subfamily B multidrug efflux pump
VDYFQDDEVQNRSYDSALMKRLLSYLGPYKRRVVASIFLLLFVSVSQLAPPMLVKLAIDRYLNAAGGLDGSARLNGLLMICAVYCGVLVVGFAFSYLQIYIMSYIGQRVMFDLRMQLFTNLQRLEVAFFDKNPVGRLMTRLTNDIEVLNDMFTSGVVSIFLDLFTLAGIVIILCSLNIRLALLSFIVLPLLFVCALLFRSYVRTSYRNVRKRIARINTFLQENLTGMFIIQIFNRERLQFHAFTGLNRKLFRAHIRSILAYAVFYPMVELLSSVAIAVILWKGGSDVLAGVITFGSLVAFIQYAQRFYRPISDLSEKYNILQSAMASSERVFGLLDTRPAIDSPRRAAPIPREPAEIRFESVRFSYNPGEEVLHGIDFTVGAGEKVAIVGYTGAGKTTIINLLSRFYDVSGGRILIGGIDVRDFALPDLRTYIATVLQDVFLFSGDVAYNINLGDTTIDDARIQEIARYINAEKFILKLPGAYREQVGERGNTLSVGERQLLAFARALVYDPKVLVLDEATSSVDTETEFLIQDALKKFMQGRTSLVIAHRLSTIRYVDRIIVLHKGNIVEEGTHQALLAKNGFYRKLYELQYKEQERTLN